MKFKVGDVVHVNEKFGSDVNGVIYPDVTEVGSFAVITEIENGGYCIRMNKTGAEYFASHEMLDAVQLRVQLTNGGLSASDSLIQSRHPCR